MIDARGRFARFGLFEVDIEHGELCRDGRRVLLQQHPLLVLFALLERPGEEVSREALRQRLWPDREFLDFENGINAAVARLRHALGDSAENPRFIATRRGRGYRLLVPVTWRPAAPDARAPSQPSSSIPRGNEPAFRVPRRRARPHVPMVAAPIAMIAATLGVALALGWNRSSGPADAASSPAPLAWRAVHPPPGERFTGSFALSPDGRFLAFVGGASRRSWIWLRSLDAGGARPLAGTEGGVLPFWAPDGSALGFFAEGELKTIEIRSGGIRTIAKAPRGRGGAWNAAGTILFAPDLDSPILSVPSRGGEPIPVTDLRGAPSHRFPCFLPDGRHFLYLLLREDRDQSEIRWGRLGGPETGPLLTAASNALYSEPGYLLFSRGASLLAQPFDAAPLRLTGPSVVVSERVSVYGEEGPTGLGAFSVASEQGALATTDVLRALLRFWWFDRQGRRKAAVGPPGDYLGFDLSGDAARVAAVAFDPRKRSSDVVAIDLNSGVQTKITDDPWPDTGVVWAPSDSRLAFLSLRQGTWTALVRETLRDGREQEVGPCTTLDGWFPDGRNVLCERVARDGTVLWKLPVNSRGAPSRVLDRRVADEVQVESRVSPRGHWLAYTAENAGGAEREVRVARLPGGRDVASLGPGRWPLWRRDERELFFLSGRQLVAVPIRPRDPHVCGKPVPLFAAPLPARDNLADYPLQFAVSPDGSRFLLATPMETQRPTAIRIVPDWAGRLTVDLVAMRPATHHSAIIVKR